ARQIENPAADTEEAGESADDQADRHQANGDRRCDADGRIALRCGRCMAMPTAIIASANRNKSLSPATSLPIEEPIAAPVMPAAANVAAHGHFTLPARQWPTRLPNALSETASALVPMATCASLMPTT